MPADPAPDPEIVRAIALRRTLGGCDEQVIAISDDVACLRRGAVDIILDRARATFEIVDRRPARDEELRAGNAQLADEAYARGMTTTPSYPRRLYLTVTEACNLRCRHCITDAPARTAAGSARTIAPWLLDALDDGFAHADYVAFTHGGESMIAPIFPEVLRRIARAPGRRDVHLITNGMLLDEARVTFLADNGVTSLMVSLDGASARKNDAIRVLGRFDTVVGNLRAAVQLRARRGYDLRIGVSTVVMRENVAELAALARLCADLGVDWLKLEEAYPVNPFARAEMLDPVPLPRAGNLLIVDHQGVPDRAADDFANRCELRPERAAWEQVAIDPDGTVHLGDYAGPPLGNLLDAPLFDLWNAPAAIRWRAGTLAGAAPPPARSRDHRRARATAPG